MAEPSPKNRTSSLWLFVRKYHRILLPLAVLVIIGAITAYVALKPDTPQETAVQPASPSQQILVLARNLLQRNQPKEAVEVLTNYLAVNRQDQEVRLRLAELYLRLGNLDQCDATLQEMLALTPDSVEAIWMQGLLAMQRGKDPGAQFRKAAKTPGASADVLGNFGLYLLSEEQVEEGRDYLQRAAAGDTSNGQVYAELGKIAFGQNQVDEAYRLLTRATQLTPQHVEAWAVLAEVQKNRNEPDQALASLRKALEFAGGAQRGMILLELGKAHMAERNWSEAAEMFSQATGYPTVRAQAAFRAAQCYYFTEAYAKAMHYIDQAANAMPNDPAVKEWKQKIENARYGQPATSPQPNPFRLTVPLEETTPTKPAESK